jgi:ribosome-associated protein
VLRGLMLPAALGLKVATGDDTGADLDDATDED